jgi:hypothetical protein
MLALLLNVYIQVSRLGMLLESRRYKIPTGVINYRENEQTSKI